MDLTCSVVTPSLPSQKDCILAFGVTLCLSAQKRCWIQYLSISPRCTLIAWNAQSSNWIPIYLLASAFTPCHSVPSHCEPLISLCNWPWLPALWVKKTSLAGAKPSLDCRPFCSHFAVTSRCLSPWTLAPFSLATENVAVFFFQFAWNLLGHWDQSCPSGKLYYLSPNPSYFWARFCYLLNV